MLVGKEEVKTKVNIEREKKQSLREFARRDEGKQREEVLKKAGQDSRKEKANTYVATGEKTD